ncbi:amino acid ABC transporter permease [Xanthobacter dioxanivorans]|uniref:Amino acid ABC transporter permease n=1 Tax=Xanthobacter dioxanivorans TaxID=2528964 RepID=A0A974PKL8_9HYPH|nr:amino acid ABC transporter permease [Xanthobacter dioxanivorans]QRG05327.1 amino acid ABC transporter permease [Xanthobacter dioxanivorans]
MTDTTASLPPGRSAPVKPFVSASLREPEPAPVSTRGPVRWVRAHLVGSVPQVLLTLFGIWLVYATVPPLIKFFIVDAVWTGTSRDACLAEKLGRPVGACWPFVWAKLDQLIYGFYPAAERWRVNVVYWLGALLLLPLLIQKLPYKRLNAIAFFGVFPVAAFVLLTGGDLDLQRFLLGNLGFGALFPAPAAKSGLSIAFWLDFVASTVLVTAIAYGISRFLSGAEGARSAAKTTLTVFAVLAVVLFVVDVPLGLPQVETRLWGGLLVTLVIAVTGITVSLPFGILLALGRRSSLPLVKAASIIFIEFWRGVPLITVLFFATYMLPLFLPGRFTIDGLLRALVGVALFASAYMAEVVRGGLQAIPKGQYEGAMAVGLRPSLMMRLVVLPQALKLVIPGIVNNFIGLFKDTTLVLIVSIFDLLGAMRAAFTDPNWASPTTLFTGFGFAGIVYFVFCFGMSRYSMALEKRLDRAQRH